MVLVGLALRILIIQIHVGRNATSFFRAARQTIASDNQGISMESNHPDAQQQNQGAAMLSHHATVKATTRESVSPLLPTQDPPRPIG